jgi:cytochrome c oxidase subunit 4
MAQHIVARILYYRIFAVLLLLTLLTVGIAYLNLGRLNNVIALTIAAGKALLVVLFFMHVRYSNRLIWIVISAGVFWLLVLLVFTLSDYFTRIILTG